MTNELNQVEEDGLDQDFMEQLKQGRHIDFILDRCEPDMSANDLNLVEKNCLDKERQRRYIDFLKSKYKPALILSEDGKPLNFQMGTSIAPVSYGFEDVNHFVSCESPTYEDMQALCLGMPKHIETLTKGIKCINKIIVESEGIDCLGDYEAALKLVVNDLEEVPT